MHRVPTQWHSIHGKQLIVKLKPSLTHACSNTINEWLLGWRASFAAAADGLPAMRARWALNAQSQGVHDLRAHACL